MLQKNLFSSLVLLVCCFLFSCRNEKVYYESEPRSNSRYSQNNYQQDYHDPAPYYAAPQYYQAPQYGRPVVPGSRYYSNPYDVPPAQYYPQQYDADQYYVPPTGYRNVERQQPAFQNRGSSPF